MSHKTSPVRRQAFLTALAQTGNQTLAAERAKVSRSWVCKQRSVDAGFDAACRAAIAEAGRHFDKLSASGEGTGKPPARWAYLDGEELVVRGTGGSLAAAGGSRERGRPQIARARLHGWSPRTEERFLDALAVLCNVKAACAHVGLTPASAYGHRQRWPAFARRWDEAVAIGYDRIEYALIMAGCSLFGQDLPPDYAELPPITGMTADHAVRLLHMHKHATRGIGKRPGLPQRMASAEETTAAILHKIAVLKREKARRGAV